MNRPISSVLAAALFSSFACVLCASCQVDVDKFQQRIFSCNPSAKEPGCGTDIEDKPMVCVAAQQLGGPNFCSRSCDRAVVPVDGNAQIACLPAGPENARQTSGAALTKCDPTVADACGHPQLACLRTDLLSNEGVCMTLSPCQTNADCRDPVRSVCMGQLLRNIYSGATLATDHTYCLQSGCRADGTSCSPGEVCLRNVVPKESKPSDICVPNCDANGNCPPNYFCYTKLYSSASPNVCLPGLMGLRCENKMDCLFGSCEDTGAGFKVCTVACQDDNDCAKYDGEHGTFFCNEKKVCAGARAFRGAVCQKQSDCHMGETCSRFSESQAFGLCLLPCGEGGVCPAYGGVNHMCLPQAKPLRDAGAPAVCWPGELGTVCVADANCIGSLKCAKAPTSPIGKCTALCREDADCQGNRFAREGYCDPTLNVCQAPLVAPAKCDRNQQCESKRCDPNTMQCAPIPGY